MPWSSMDHQIALAERRDLGDELVGAARPAYRAGSGGRRRCRPRRARIRPRSRSRARAAAPRARSPRRPPPRPSARTGRSASTPWSASTMRRRSSEPSLAPAITTRLPAASSSRSCSATASNRLTSGRARSAAKSRARRPPRSSAASAARSVGAANGDQIEPLALVQQIAQRLLAEVELIRRQGAIRRGAHGARGFGRAAPRRIVLADGLLAALERSLGQLVEPDRPVPGQVVGDRRPDARGTAAASAPCPG